MRIAREDSDIGQTDPDRLADRSYIYLKLFSSPVSEVPDASLTWLLNQLCTKQSPPPAHTALTLSSSTLTFYSPAQQQPEM